MFRGYQSAFRRAVTAALEAEGFAGKAEVSVTLVSKEEIRRLNLEYRGIDKETDVLSFPLWEAGEEMVPVGKWTPLGDVILCPAVIVKQAGEFKTTPRQEFCLMVIHSILHLLGWDHMEEQEKKQMFARQEQILSSLCEGDIKTETERMEVQ